MRLDKFLKNSRLIKRRTVAKEACQQGRVTVIKAAEYENVGAGGPPAPAGGSEPDPAAAVAAASARPAKPGTEVEAGDVIHIEFGTGSVTVRVLATPETVRKEEAETLYEVIE